MLGDEADPHPRKAMSCACPHLRNRVCVLWFFETRGEGRPWLYK